MHNIIKTKIDQLVDQLHKSEQLSKLITGIFYNIPANQNYPFIHLTNINIKNYPLKTIEAKEVVFDMIIYTKSNDFAKLNLISDLVAHNLSDQSELILQNSKITITSKTNIYENKMTVKAIIFGD